MYICIYIYTFVYICLWDVHCNILQCVTLCGYIAVRYIVWHFMCSFTLQLMIWGFFFCRCPLPTDFVDARYWDEMQGYWNVRMALRLLYEKRLGAASSWKV